MLHRPLSTTAAPTTSAIPATASTPVATTSPACRYGTTWCIAGQAEHEPCRGKATSLIAPGFTGPKEILGLSIEDYGSGPRLTFSADGRDCCEINLDQLDQLRSDLLGLAAALGDVRRDFERITWAQATYDRAVGAGLPPRTLLQVAEALRSPNPVASVEWLLSVETDETARCGFEAALEVLRARGGDQ